jgi:MFS superfamily sulfate permease-like transporter
MVGLARGLRPSSYRREWLARDVVAGIVLSTLPAPQGMAYAELAGLPPITGLYTSVLCLLGYALAGPSRILVLGPDSALGPRRSCRWPALTATRPGPSHWPSMLAIMVGAIMVLAVVARLGSSPT